MESSTPTRRPKRGLRLTTRLSLAFALLLGFFLVSVAGTAVGFHRIQREFELFGKASAFASQISDINRDVIEMQRHVQVFVNSGNEHSPETIRRLGAKLTSRIDRALHETDDEPTRYRLKKMRLHLESYLKNFESVIEERQLRRRIIEERILQPAKAITANLEPLAGSKKSTEAVTRDEARQALAFVSLAQISALRYLSEPDSELVRRTLSHIRKAKRIFANSTASDEMQTNLTGLLRQFEQGFLRTVQATRGYSYFVNVVMAGEAAEFLFQARKLKERSVTNMEQISAATKESTEQATQFVFALSITAVVLGLIISLSFIRSVVRPIAEITETLTCLGSGQDVAVVPGLNRSDEIGEMARAADVFRDKNRETKRLLEESQRMTRELDAKAAQLERSNRDLDSFAYVASHDLRSPLRAIDNLSEWIAEDAYDVLPEESREHFGLLRQRVGRMESLLNDLLEYSRAGRIQAETEIIDSGTLVQEVHETIDWPSEMELHIEPEMPTLTTERLPLLRVFHNLLTNAVKYRSKDAPAVRVSGRRVENGCEFTVSDNGPGIEPQYHEQIFEMFKRLHAQDDIEGSGMGLALIKKLIESFGGAIRVESELGQGTTFRFTWMDANDGDEFPICPSGGDCKLDACWNKTSKNSPEVWEVVTNCHDRLAAAIQELQGRQ